MYHSLEELHNSVSQFSTLFLSLMLDSAVLLDEKVRSKCKAGGF